MSDLKTNNKGGSFKTGVWIKRINYHANNEENGYLTKGKSYQVMSPEKYYSTSEYFRNRNGNIVPETDLKLKSDCVMLRDDEGKIGLFGVKNFHLTSGQKVKH